MDRFGLKSFSSPYASGRSNIKYILGFEQENFRDLLDPAFLTYEEADETKVVRNKKFVETQNKYDPSCSRGLEFTHHDVLGQKDKRNAIDRRCRRMLALKDRKINMLYHHRYCPSTDLDVLTQHLGRLQKIYTDRGNQAEVFCFLQVIVADKSQRKIVRRVINGVRVYFLYTLQVWQGADDVFFARVDDDLLAKMIADMKKSRYRR